MSRPSVAPPSGGLGRVGCAVPDAVLGRSPIQIGQAVRRELAAALSTLIAWCGFVGSWLLVAGPLDQAVRELREEDFEREAFLRASEHVEAPPSVSRRWALLPPAYVVLMRRRSNTYRRLVAKEMDSKDLTSLAHLRDVAATWIYVAAGASLIAVTQAWVLREEYEWPRWAFWAALANSLAVKGSVAIIAAPGVSR